MALHLIKLCVGAESVEDLVGWQMRKLSERQKKRMPQELVHVTRQTPKRRDELLDGGSLYWIIKGYTSVRQPLLDLRPTTDRAGVPHCEIVYAPELVPVLRRAHRPFQGWRYLKPEDAPPDVDARSENLPEILDAQLRDLGLL